MKAQPITRSPRLFRPSAMILGLISVCALCTLPGCDTYNPYLGASPTVSSSISSISPSGASAGAQNDVLLTVTGSGFVPGSNVTWSSSGGSAINLVSNFISGAEMQASIPSSFLAAAGTFSIGVIAPGPTSGNNAGNNISNFVPFIVFPATSSSVTPTLNPRISAAPKPSSPLSGSIQAIMRFQPLVADSADGSIETGGGIARIFLRDSCVGAAKPCAPQVIPISVGWNGTDPNGPSSSPSVTANGRFVVFASEANNLVKGDSNGESDIFLRDICIGASPECVPGTTRVSVGPDGVEANGASFAPAISPDGRFVIFNSWATNLAQSDYLNSLSKTSVAPLFLRDTCFAAAAGCVPETSRVIPVSGLQR